MEINNLFDGSMTDEEVVGVLEDWYKGNPNIDKTKFADNFESLRLPKIKAYFEQLKNTDSYLADNPKILDGILTKLKEICGSNNRNK